MHRARQDKFTYCSGPSIATTKFITTKTIVNLIDALHSQFGPEYQFAPEAVYEGGIVMVSWPGPRYSSAYKTFRFHLRGGEWPCIKKNTLESWRHGAEEIIWHPTAPVKLAMPKIKGTLFLKAFRGAPVWTQEELQLVVKAFTMVGFTCKKIIIPPEELEQVGELGVPH